MIILAGQQGRAGFRPVALAGQADAQGGLAVQPVRQAGGELRVHMLHDDHRRRKIGRQRGQHFGQGRRAARGGADADQVAAMLRGLPRDRWRRSRRAPRALSADQLADGFDLRQQGLRRPRARRDVRGPAC